MLVNAVKTAVITAGKASIEDVIGEAIAGLSEGSVLAVTSKIVSLCEGSVVPVESTDKDQLIIEQSDYYLPRELSQYGMMLSITNSNLIPAAGIDESNGGGVYVLWPRDAQNSANAIRAWARKQYGVTKLGVVITDSTTPPLRKGTVGIAIAHSGFLALKNYIGEPDLFDREQKLTKASIRDGLAAAAVLAMGEGAEQTPLAVLSDLPFVEFCEQDPDGAELAELNIKPQDDIYASLLTIADWQPGGRSKK